MAQVTDKCFYYLKQASSRNIHRFEIAWENSFLIFFFILLKRNYAGIIRKKLEHIRQATDKSNDISGLSISFFSSLVVSNPTDAA